MARREDTLVAQIERDALSGDIPLATALRKCIVLGGKSGSEQLRDWATRELQGYHGPDELPDYRVIAAQLVIDGATMQAHITRQPFPRSALPDFAQDKISETVELRDGVASLEALARQSEIKLAPPMANDLVRIMNAEHGDRSQQITALYWAVSPTAVHGVVDQIRTGLTQLVAELRATMPQDAEVPSAEAADQAVAVVVTGKRAKVHVTAAQASGAATAKVSEPHPDDSPFWTRSRKIGAFVVGVASLAASVVAVVQFL